MNYREQKDYLDKLEKRLTIRYGKKPHERDMDKTCSQQILPNRSGFIKPQTPKCVSPPNRHVSLPKINKPQLQTDSNFIPEIKSHYNSAQCEKNRELVEKRSRFISGSDLN